MKEELWKELKKLLEDNDLMTSHQLLYDTVCLISESIELGKRQNEVTEKLQKLSQENKEK